MTGSTAPSEPRAVGTRGEDGISPEALEAVRRRVGVEYPAVAWNEVATRDAIRHFAEGTGDPNPLWSDPDYAAASPHGGIIAPPTFLHVFSSAGATISGPGLPGVFALYAGDEFEFVRPVREGERIVGRHRILELQERRSQWATTGLHQLLETAYYDAEGELVGRLVNRLVRAGRSQARAKSKTDSAWEPYRYSKSEMGEIGESYEAEERRGGVPRYVDSVSEGDSLGHVTKGPLTVTDMVTWMMGWGGPLCKAHAIAWQFFRKHPGAAIIDPTTNIPDLAEAAHWDLAFAQRSGVKAMYDIGFQRVAWFSHLVTNWMGDHGELRWLKVDLKKPNYVGDCTWIRGEVERVAPDDSGTAVVHCRMWADNQRGDRHAVGSAQVVLPTKG
jgi:acyl dehydratase